MRGESLSIESNRQTRRKRSLILELARAAEPLPAQERLQNPRNLHSIHILPEARMQPVAELHVQISRPANSKFVGAVNLAFIEHCRLGCRQNRRSFADH